MVTTSRSGFTLPRGSQDHATPTVALGGPFGAVVENRGEVGPVTVHPVDTSDMSDRAVLATRTVEMDAGERRTVTFTVRDRYEWFRVDVYPGDAAG